MWEMGRYEQAWEAPSSGGGSGASKGEREKRREEDAQE